MERMIKILDEPALKDVLYALVRDASASGAFERLLLTGTRKATLKAYASILQDANRTFRNLYNVAFRMKHTMSTKEFGNAMRPFVTRITALRLTGYESGGLELAWKAFLIVADLAVIDWRSGELKLEDDEDANDEFHEKVDRAMYGCCMQLEAYEPGALREKLAELNALMQRQKGPRGVLNYRYATTRDYLEWVENGKPDVPLPSPSGLLTSLRDSQLGKTRRSRNPPS